LIAAWSRKSGQSSFSAFHLPIPTALSSRLSFTVRRLRGSQFEVKVQVPFLKEGAFIAQSIATYPTIRAIRKLGTLNATQLADVETAVFQWLGRG
jgi:hypothetical protein